MSVRPIAQQDPVPNLSERLGQAVYDARRQVEYLVTTLRELDTICGQLAAHDIKIDVDLGPIGNAAAAARRDLERESGKPTFSFPKPR